jgi:D-sedoheptulose 7-phosphate isomerase
MACTTQHLNEASEILSLLDQHDINRIVESLAGTVLTRGPAVHPRVGGGAGNDSHAVNNSRKIAGIEA